MGTSRFGTLAMSAETAALRNVNQNVVPSWSFDVTPMRPPSASTACRQNVRPSPVERVPPESRAWT